MVTSASLDELLRDELQPTDDGRAEQSNCEPLTSLGTGVVAVPDQLDQPGSETATPNTQATPRKPGQRKPTYDDESTADMLKTSKSLLRTDWGGKSGDDALEVIRKEFAAAGVQAGPLACEVARKIAEKQVDGCRKRAFPRIDAAITRLDATPVVEVLP